MRLGKDRPEESHACHPEAAEELASDDNYDGDRAGARQPQVLTPGLCRNPQRIGCLHDVPGCQLFSQLCEACPGRFVAAGSTQFTLQVSGWRTRAHITMVGINAGLALLGRVCDPSGDARQRGPLRTKDCINRTRIVTRRGRHPPLSVCHVSLEAVSRLGSMLLFIGLEPSDYRRKCAFPDGASIRCEHMVTWIAANASCGRWKVRRERIATRLRVGRQETALASGSSVHKRATRANLMCLVTTDSAWGQTQRRRIDWWCHPHISGSGRVSHCAVCSRQRNAAT
jgi:hypothetical protein